MTNAEWLIQNKIPFQNINIHIDYIKGIANIYIKDYEKIVYNLEPNDPNDEAQEEMVADKEYSVTELNLGFDFEFES